MFDDGFMFYWHNARDTLYEAFVGWLWGNVLAILLAFSFLVAPILERPLTRLGVVSYCLPIIAIAPILTIKFHGQAPNIILAALSVFFTTLVGTLVGLRSADQTALDMVHAYGGGAIKKLTKVRLRAALPSLFAALPIAAPAAILGAIIGDYFGAERGLGVAMIAAQTGLEIPRTWGLAIVAAALAGVAYGITALVGRLLTPWAPRGARVVTDHRVDSRRRSRSRRSRRSGATENRALRYRPAAWSRWSVSLAVVLGFWQLFLIVFHVDHFVGKTPARRVALPHRELHRGRAAERCRRAATSTRRRSRR